MENRKPIYNPDEIPDMPEMENRGWEAMRSLLEKHMPEKKKRKPVIPLYWRWMVAAVLLVVFGLGGYKFLGMNQSGNPNSHLEVVSLSSTQTTSNIKIASKIAANRRINKDSVALKKVNLNGRDIVPSINQKKSLFAEKTSKPTFYAKSAVTISNRDIAIIFKEKFRQGNTPVTSKTLKPNNDVSVLEKDIVALNFKNNIALNTANKDKIRDHSMNVDNSKIINMAVIRINDAHDRSKVAVNNLFNNENVEGRSEFRRRLNLAIQDSAKSDSLQEMALEKKKKLMTDSQLTARRQQQLTQFFEQREKEENNSSSKPKSKIALAVMVNRSMTDKGYSKGSSSLYSLPVYPSVNASVQISDKIGLTTGLSTAAPGNFTNTTFGGSVSMSSPAYAIYVKSNGLQLNGSDKAFLTSSSSTSKEVTLSEESSSQIQQAYYWQVPLLFDYYIAHFKLKLSAGTDFSIIQKVLVGTGSSAQLMDGGTYNNSGGVYQVRNFDPRVSIGAQYQLNKVLIGVRFSRSFQPALQYNGAATNGGNNQVFNLSIGYSFFK